MTKLLKDIKATLEWYQNAGVDEAIETTPQSRSLITEQTKLAPSATIAALNKPLKHPQHETHTHIGTSTPNTQNTIALHSSPSQGLLEAKKLAEGATSLEELKEAVENFHGLSIRRTAQNTVFSDGNPDANIMLIGEAPGADEDRYGIPFCGASGQLLDQMLGCIGLLRPKNFYITNTIFWRPPGNRKPTPEEIALCKPFVEKHIALFAPKLIILVGGTAVSSVLDVSTGITKIRGKFYDYSNEFLKSPIKTTALFLPSYLLRSPGQKRIAWKDLLQIDAYLSQQKINN